MNRDSLGGNEAEQDTVIARILYDVYGHVTEQMKQASASRMESYIKQVLEL